MLIPNSTLFISDLHLNPRDHILQNLFLNFLQGPAQYAQSIYILGDLFDVWVGEDINRDFQHTILLALKSLSEKGITLFFMAGNRDFLLGTSFLNKANIKNLSDPTLISLYNIPTLLTHGDKLCTQDVVYQRYRRIAQHPFTKRLFLGLPKKIRRSIGLKLRQKSKNHQQNQASSILDVAPTTVHDLMKRYRVRQLIHGHVHRPHIHDVYVHDQSAKRLVLGDWQEKASFIISNTTEIALATYDPKNGIQTIKSYNTLSLF